MGVCSFKTHSTPSDPVVANNKSIVSGTAPATCSSLIVAVHTSLPADQEPVDIESEGQHDSRVLAEELRNMCEVGIEKSERGGYLVWFEPEEFTDGPPKARVIGLWCLQSQIENVGDCVESE